MRRNTAAMALIILLIVTFGTIAGCVILETERKVEREEEKPVQNITGKKIVVVIAPENFKDQELFETKSVIEDVGGSVLIACSESGKAIGVDGAEVYPELLLSSVDPDSLDALVFIGGPGAEVYFHDDTAHDLVNEAVAKNKVVAAICIAPCILAYAGVLNGKNATVWSDSKEYINILEAEGAHYTGDTVTVDGKLITANGPDATQSFAKMIVKLLAGEN